jgi:orotate phosphoribosyltransferase
MLAHQRDFLELAARLRVLRFGRCTLKSGRESPADDPDRARA